jgi:NAD+ synthase
VTLSAGLAQTAGAVAPAPVRPAADLPWDAGLLQLDAQAEADKIADWLVQAIGQRLKRRGAVVALSGGIDSAVCAALAVRALGPDRVLGLMLPERESSPQSGILAVALCQQLGIEARRVDITCALESVGAYAQRDDAIRRVLPAYGDGWRNRIVIAGGLSHGINFFRLEALAPDGQLHRVRLPHAVYLQIVAATNYKQRLRKVLEYGHADTLHRAVIGTPNRLEYALGFFVKQGDGAADVKPIAHLYKSQVCALAEALGVPAAIREAVPTTDTYTLAQGQDEFFYGLPLWQMDLALWAQSCGLAASAVAAGLGLPLARAELVLADIRAKRAAAASLHASGLTLPMG